MGRGRVLFFVIDGVVESGTDGCAVLRVLGNMETDIVEFL